MRQCLECKKVDQELMLNEDGICMSCWFKDITKYRFGYKMHVIVIGDHPDSDPGRTDICKFNGPDGHNGEYG